MQQKALRVGAGVTAVLLSSALLAACGGNSSTDSTSSSAEASAQNSASSSAPGSPPAALSGTLTMAAYGGETQDALAAAYAVPFTEQTGVEVVQDPTFDYGKLDAQVQSGNVTWDVVEADPFSTIGGCGTQFEIVTPDLAGIDPVYAQDDRCGVPANVYSIVLMYDKTKFGDNPPTSWADFFDTTAFPGKRGVFNYVVGGALEAAAVASGKAPGEVYPLDVDASIAKLNTIKDDIVFYNSLGQSVEQLLAGDVAMSMMWNTRAFSAVEEGATYEPVWDGNIQGWDSMAVPKGSKNLDAAKAFLAYVAEPEPQAALANSIPFGPTALDAVVDPNAPSFPYLPSEHKDDAVFLDQNWWSENYGNASTSWSEFAAS